jgi:adenylate cyclase
MGVEIERKFLLRGDLWRHAAVRRLEMRQGYLAGTERASIRVRVAGDQAWLNIKSGGLVAQRREFEYSIPVDQGREILSALCELPPIEKARHYVPFEGFEWEIDEFHGLNAGLIVAELELEREDQEFPRPEWLGEEVTHLGRYYNVCLSSRPYSQWTQAERSP